MQRERTLVGKSSETDGSASGEGDRWRGLAAVLEGEGEAGVDRRAQGPVHRVSSGGEPRVGPSRGEGDGLLRKDRHATLEQTQTLPKQKKSWR